MTVAEPSPRSAMIRAMFDSSGRGLEIGGSYNPIVPRSAGFNVETVDHATATQLRAKYAQDPSVDVSRIEAVDHVWDGRPLSDVVPRSGCYDYIVASHVIEHTPDLLGFLDACDRLLAPGGILFLAVPDKRRCFDVFRPLASTGDVLQAHHERRRIHTPGTGFDHVAYSAALDGNSGWNGGAQGALAPKHDLGFAKAVFERSAASSDYFDFHAWMFTPSSFRLIVADLNAIDALSLREVTFRATAGMEFYITLGRSGAGAPLDRLTLMQAILQEVAEHPSPSPPPMPPGWVQRLRSRLLRYNTQVAKNGS